MPKSRLDFWEAKLQGNLERDRRHISELDALGWQVLVVWECDIRDREQLKNTLRSFLTEEDHK